MLKTIVGLLIVLWILGFILKIGNFFIHVLLAIAVIIFIFDLLKGRSGSGN
jgi:hypothetical protein